MPVRSYETCRHVTSKGELIVYVTSGCPRAVMVNGVLASSKIRCRECKRRGRYGIRRKTGIPGEDTRDQERV